MDSDGYMEVPAMNMAETHGGLVINTGAQFSTYGASPFRTAPVAMPVRAFGQLSWMLLRKLLVCVRRIAGKHIWPIQAVA